MQPFLAPRLARLNHSRVLAAGAAMVGLGFGMNALAHGAWLFAAAVAVWTVGEIFTLPIANAVVADLAPTHIRGRYQGAYGLTFGLAGFAAPLIGTSVLQHFGDAALWLGCLALGVLVGVGHLLLAPRLTRLREQRRAIETPAYAAAVPTPASVSTPGSA